MHEGNGLSELGKELVKELNRVGILVDLSHTTDATMRQAIALSEAPVVWTHAGARALKDHPRNVPDDILRLIGDGPDKKDGVIQSVFFPHFIGPYPGANVSHVADHIEHIAGIVGRNRVGIASDFDGMYLTVEGLEDATKYPNLERRPLIEKTIGERADLTPSRLPSSCREAGRVTRCEVSWVET